MSGRRRRRTSTNLSLNLSWADTATGVYSLRRFTGGQPVQTSSGLVTRWINQRGGSDLIPGNSPPLTNSGISFTASNSTFLQTEPTSFGIGADFSAFAVVRHNSFLANSGIFSLIPPTPSPSDRDWASSAGRAISQSASLPQVGLVAHNFFSGSNGFSDAVSTIVNAPLNQYYILSITQGNGIASIQVNNDSPVLDTYNGTPTSPSGLVLGARFNSGVNGHGSFDIQELIIFPLDVSTSRNFIVSEINKYYRIF